MFGKTEANLRLLNKVLGSSILYKLENTPQNPKWHPEGCVLNHILQVMECTKYSKILTLVAMIHDLGKIDTTVQKNGEWTSPRHEYFFEKYLPDLNLTDFSIEEIIIATEIALQHMRAHLYKNGKMSNLKKRKKFEEHHLFQLIIEFSDCDEKRFDIS